MNKFINIMALLLLLVLSQSAAGQSRKEKKAARKFESFHYKEALDDYLQIYESGNQSEEVIRRIAFCYKQQHMPREAATWYARLFEKYDGKPEDMLAYAEALSALERYEAAKEWYTRYYELSEDPAAKRYVEAYNRLPYFFADSSKYELKAVDFNTEYDEFSPAFFKEGIVFCSNRITQTVSSGKQFKWDGTAFLDLYFYEKGSVRPLHNELNSPFHEGPLVFTADEKTVYFTRNNYFEGKYKQSSDGVNKLKLFIADVDANGNFSNVREFAYNSNEYSVAHPALSPDGNTLYFSSDMPGGYGASDLYRCRREGDSWSKPENLGAFINTSGRESFPFVDEEGRLYFASTGHGGLGGLDIFVCEPDGNGGFKEPVNLGYPINSSQDDFGLIYRPSQRTGYFSARNRPYGAGRDDIYYFRVKDENRSLTEKPVLVVVRPQVIDAWSKAPVSQAKLSYVDPVQKASPVNEGDTLRLYAGNYILKAEAPDYEAAEKTIEVEKNPPLQTVQPTLALRPAVSIYHTYYPYNKWDITPEAAQQLRSLAALMKKYPEFTLQIETHTDKRASDKYNDWLSAKRAEAVKAFLVNEGVPAERIDIVAAGERKPVADCESCDKLSHQLNRRAEYLLKGYSEEIRSKQPEHIPVME